MQHTQDIQAAQLRLREERTRTASRRRQLQVCRHAREVERREMEMRVVDIVGLGSAFGGGGFGTGDLSRRALERKKAVLRKRQRELICDLERIFPIEQSTFDDLVYTIRGIRLPNSDYAGQDEDRIATALGFTSHLVTVLAFYLDVPLRYPIKPMSSRSTIWDRNIEQLMNHVGLSVTNLRNTLPNLKTLIQTIANWDGDEDLEDDLLEEEIEIRSVPDVSTWRIGYGDLSNTPNPVDFRWYFRYHIIITFIIAILVTLFVRSSLNTSTPSCRNNKRTLLTIDNNIIINSGCIPTSAGNWLPTITVNEGWGDQPSG
ncbi:hypothetical protein HK102_001260 [Quaeritorhiza haematococci]|nr:hypothetical protein HK102_001260 [Quaeritorhiza haematococci]